MRMLSGVNAMRVDVLAKLPTLSIIFMLDKVSQDGIRVQFNAKSTRVLG